MTKSRKKKNYKLRRRVKRTVAALTMIMAIVVAAIPVENYGTMQASGVDGGVNLADNASLYLENRSQHYETSSQESAYGGTEVTAQHIEGDSFINAFKIKLKSGSEDAMITESVFERDLEKFDIHEVEYYEYVQMSADYLKAVENAFDGETYSLTFTNDHKSYTARTETITDASGANVTLNLNAVSYDLISTESPSETITNTASGSLDSTLTGSNPYVSIKAPTSNPKIFETYTPVLLKSHTERIDAYNTEMKRYTDVLDGIKDKTPLTRDDEAKWNEAVNNITTLNGSAASLSTFSKTFAEMRAEARDEDEDDNDLPDIVDYAICQRIASNANGDLVKYVLKKLTSPGGAVVYVPKNNSPNGPDSGQKNDDEGYLAGGKANIKGIASRAFDVTSFPDNSRHPVGTDREVGTITIPATVEFIGVQAFSHSNFLKDVTIDDTNLTILADEAFAQCPSLATISFTSENSRLKTIGCQAFYNTALDSIIFPPYVETIGAGCLYLSDIQEMTMGGLRNATLTIEPYAFFGCEKLTKVNFAGESTNFKMGDAIFALTSSQGGGALENFSFPSYMNQIDNGQDYAKYILAGRENLKTVVLPGRLGNSVTNDDAKFVPDETFAGCKNLEWVEFPDGAYDAKYHSDKLFAGVLNDKFYVKGPETGASSNSIASPRSCTWNAIPGYTTEDGKPGVVPYVFKGADGKEHMEIGVGEENRDDYIARIDIIEGTKNAILSGYIENHPTGNPLAVVIPATVGGYTITEIADGCFKDVSDIIYKIVIADATVQKINANAFKGCDKLQWVELGDSVSFIGAGAFEGCKSLENVVFSQTQTALFGDVDSYWKDALTIEPNAFKTGSDFLTFHGAVHPDYAPFKLAMSEDSKSMTGTSLPICYKTDAPTNLTILRDNATGESTLIDYPHYEEIDTINADLIKLWAKGDSGYSITDKFEELNELKNVADPNYAERPFNNYKNFNEKDIPLYTLFMTLPKGIDSIDASAYYKRSENANDLVYLTRTYESQTKFVNGKDIEVGIKGVPDGLKRDINQRQTYSRYDDVKSVYSDDKYISESDLNEFGQKAGLFSGFLAESELSMETGITDSIPGIIWRTYNGHKYVENSIVGNDYLTTIDLRTVKELPDYAFLSCENLLSTKYGMEMQKIGALPYRNCKNLTNIEIPEGNQYVQFANMILFRKNQTNSSSASGLEIIQCLEGRGSGSNNGGSFKIGEASGDTLLANVVSIDKEAFSYCEEITEVDLSTSKITQLPERCFYKAIKLSTVKLPDSIETIGEEAFLQTSDNVEVTIPNPSCAIGETAFNFDGNRKVTIRGPQYDASGTRNSAIYNYYLKMKEKLRPQGKEENIIFVSEDKHKVTFIDYDTSMIEDPEVPNPQYVDHGANAVCVAKPQRSGYEFSAWKCILSDGTQFTGSGDPWLNVTEDRIIQAVYEPNANIIVPDGNDYKLTMVDGTANGQTEPITAKGGDKITIAPITKTDGSQFQYWSVEPKDYTNLFVNGVATANGTFIMPNDDVTLTANFSSGNKPGGDNGNKPGEDNGNEPGGDNGNKPGTDSSKKYKVTVNYGSGSGEYAAGVTVNISAFAPESSSRVFSKWTTNNSGLGFANANAATTSFIMPAADVTVTANYRVRTDDDDDDDQPSRRPGTNTNTNTVTNRPSSSTGTTGTTGTVTNPATGSTNTGSTNNNGNKIYITKNGVSNTDVASISVDGSTDNFIVRITESAEATAAVEEALINKHGSLDGLAYFPMDISLYDSTGQNKITDTYGLNITVTMPIPDVLIQYGGNARVAAADNGNLQQLTPRFTTIDGIACISFVPPHFSPYVIYVDTNNLIAGQTLDATPSTGDPIHPKWFAAIGMACISIILFATSDGRRRRNFGAA